MTAATSTIESPKGELVIQAIAMPLATNPHGDIFGGWIMSQMDLGGAVLAKQYTKERVVTVAVEALVFHSPVAVGDLVTCYAQLVQVGNTSISIAVDVWVYRFCVERKTRVTEGVFTYVAVDDASKPIQISVP